jgi:hypothetical protein
LGGEGLSIRILHKFGRPCLGISDGFPVQNHNPFSIFAFCCLTTDKAGLLPDLPVNQTMLGGQKRFSSASGFNLKCAISGV